MDNVPDALVVGDGGQRLGQYLVIFAQSLRMLLCELGPLPPTRAFTAVQQRCVGSLTRYSTAVTCPTLASSERYRRRRSLQRINRARS